jgi:hypothetical protein
MKTCVDAGIAGTLGNERRRGGYSWAAESQSVNLQQGDFPRFPSFRYPIVVLSGVNDIMELDAYLRLPRATEERPQTKRGTGGGKRGDKSAR